MRIGSINTASNRFREGAAFYLFITPWIIGFLAFTVGPILASLVFSFLDYEVITPPVWVGLRNFADLLADPLFNKTLYNTAYYVFFSVPLGVATAFGLALLLNQKVRGVAVYRTIFYLPSVVPVVANVLLWLWILQPQWGLLNSLLQAVGIPGPLWLADENWSKPALIIMSVWGVGGSMVIFLAGLQGVPEQLYDAASIDGANAWQRFLNVTVPMLTPTIFFVLVMGVIGSFQVFTNAYIMTNGGPVDSTLFYMLYLYQQGWYFLHMGYAAAMAWILFILVMVLTIIQFGLAPRWVHYG